MVCILSGRSGLFLVYDSTWGIIIHIWGKNLEWWGEIAQSVKPCIRYKAKEDIGEDPLFIKKFKLECLDQSTP